MGVVKQCSVLISFFFFFSSIGIFSYHLLGCFLQLIVFGVSGKVVYCSTLRNSHNMS